MNIRQEIALMRYVQESIGRPFSWGQCDCNTFALEAADAAYGTALAAMIVGKYSTALGAIRYRRRSSWKTLQTLLAENGWIQAKKGFEQTGDVLIARDPRWEMAHVCLGPQAASAFPDDGVRIFPVAAIRNEQYQVWRLPCLP